MKILISNDDGVYADGLRTLANALIDDNEVIVVAPDRNRSGASNSLTLDSPLRSQELDDTYISVQGTPTDCVHLAITGLLDFHPDIVLSGINDGPNLGDDILYSGTVAAAMEGRYMGYPAIAFSMAKHFPKYYNTAAEVAKRILNYLQKFPLPPTTILNVNVPDVPFDEIEGFAVTRLGTRHKAEPTIKDTDPRGKPIYWVGPTGPEQDAGEGTDFWAIRSGLVSITPLQIDLTNYSSFDNLAQWVSGMNECHS